MKKFIKSYGWLILSLILLIPILLPLWPLGFPASYDIVPHLMRMKVFHEAILDGQIFPRWSTALAYGFGSPVLMFNWNLLYYLAELFLFLGFSYTDSIKWVFVLGFGASVILMFFFLKEWLGKESAFLGSIIYAWAPYRFTEIYRRAGVGEATAFVFWPMVFWAVVLAQRKRYRKSFFIGTLGFFALMLSHQVMIL